MLAPLNKTTTQAVQQYPLDLALLCKALRAETKQQFQSWQVTDLGPGRISCCRVLVMQPRRIAFYFLLMALWLYCRAIL